MSVDVHAPTPAEDLPVGNRPTVPCPRIMWHATGLDAGDRTIELEGTPEAATAEAAAIAWARAGMHPMAVAAVVRVARVDDPKHVVWRRVLASRTFSVSIVGEPARAAS